ncbi:zinc finger protein SNAI3 [Rhinophrynus dorsalis]
MPRSFLVKKSSSHRIPNYGQLLEAQNGVTAACVSCPGLVLSLIQNEGPSTPEHDTADQWDAHQVQSQTPLDTGQKEQHDSVFFHHLGNRSGDSLSDLATELPLTDSMNNLNVPLRNLALDGGNVMPEVKTSQQLLLQKETVQQPHSLGCTDFDKVCGMMSTNKSRRCYVSVRRSFSCQECNKSYTSLGALKMHIRTHSLPCTCRICGKAFSRPWLLQGHVRTHTGEKPFSCFHCGRGFADRSNLRAHLQTHSDVKRYGCPGCGKTFSRISLLVKHRDACCCPVS